MMLRALTCGLSVKASAYLVEALEAVYGEGSVQIETLASSAVRVQSRVSQSDSSVVLVVLDQTATSEADPQLLSSKKFLEFRTDSSFVMSLNELWGINLVYEAPASSLATSPTTSSYVVDSEELSAAYQQIELLQSQLAEMEVLYDVSSFQELQADNLRLQSELVELRTVSATGPSSEEFSTLQLRFDEQSVIVRNQREELTQSSERIRSLRVRVSELSESSAAAPELEAKISQLTEELSEATSTRSVLESKLATQEATIKEANLRILALSQGEASAKELSSQVETLASNPFLRLSEVAQPRSPLGINISVPSYDNLSWVFAGADGSIKGSYRQMQSLADQLHKKSHRQVLIVDLSAESSLDYVAGLEHLTPATGWLSSGGNLIQYLTSTKTAYVNVLSMGLDYFNDAFLISVDWASRLQELSSSGYEVLLFGGSLSTLVGRFLLHNLATNPSNVTVVVEGFTTSIRALMLNLQSYQGTPDIQIVNRFVENDFTLNIVNYWRTLGHRVTGLGK